MGFDGRAKNMTATAQKVSRPVTWKAIRYSPVAAAEGRAAVETYTVLFGRDGEPERGIVIGRLATGERFLAETPDDTALLEAIVAREMVGAEGKVSQVDGHHRFDPA